MSGDSLLPVFAFLPPRELEKEREQRLNLPFSRDPGHNGRKGGSVPTQKTAAKRPILRLPSVSPMIYKREGKSGTLFCHLSSPPQSLLYVGRASETTRNAILTFQRLKPFPESNEEKERRKGLLSLLSFPRRPEKRRGKCPPLLPSKFITGLSIPQGEGGKKKGFGLCRI